MIISNSQIQFASHHSYRERSKVQENLVSARLDAPPTPRELPAPTINWQAPTVQPHPLRLTGPMDANNRLQMLIIAQLFKQITGRELRLMTPEQPPGAPRVAEVQLPTERPVMAPSLVYERHTRYEETEKMQFSAVGKVVTQDGREIAIGASLSMSRQFVSTTSITLGNAVMTDPLVINFDGTGAQLDSTRFAFDLDADGTPEQIASLRPNSGYLALDRNGDGKINDGRELFGPTSNNGFAELAVYDEDGNGFIDEGDSIYHQLRIWQVHSDGSSTLVALGDRQIGAIYLGHTQTPMQLKDEQNRSLGEVVSSGIYLREDGTTGVIQQINLAV